MTRPLPARLVLLAAAAALAACLVFAMIVAEHRDVDGGAPKVGGVATELRVGGAAAAPAETPRAVPVSAR